MKILWIGDAVSSTGFARCTHAACDALHAAGHDVTVIGINFYGGPECKEYPYDIYPPFDPPDSGTDMFGVTRLPTIVERLRPDLIIILQDIWNIPSYIDYLKANRRHEQTCALQPDNEGDECDCIAKLPPIIGWLAVDAKNQPGEAANRLTHAITWTEFGRDELVAGGYTGSTSIVPLGVDLDIFHPYDKAECRQRFLPEQVNKDAFIVGVVGRNQPRKRLDLTIEYFAEWIKSHNIDDALLYCHVAPTGDRGFEMTRLSRYHGISGRLVISTPHTGQGMPTETMPRIMSMFDAYLSTSAGEGWGLPALEAMACGVPCVVPDYAALGEWPGDAAIKVFCSGSQVNAPINALAYTIGGVPDRQACVWALASLYSDRGLRERYSEAGLDLAKGFSWKATGEQFVEVIEQIVAPRRLRAV